MYWGSELLFDLIRATLSYLKHAKEPVGQQARWVHFIEQFVLELQYRKGTSHANADALSRRPCENQGQLCRQCTNKSQAPEGHVVGSGPLGSVGQKEDCRTDYRAEAGYEDRPGCSTEKAVHSNAVTTRAQAQRKEQREGRAQSDTGLPSPADCSLEDDVSCSSNLAEYENIPPPDEFADIESSGDENRFHQVSPGRTQPTRTDRNRPDPTGTGSGPNQGQTRVKQVCLIYRLTGRIRIWQSFRKVTRTSALYVAGSRSE